MRNLFILGGVVVIAIFSASFFYNRSINKSPVPISSSDPRQISAADRPTPAIQDRPLVSIVAEGLDTPWAIAFLPNKEMLVTERGGKVRLLDGSGKLQAVAELSRVKEIGEGGLMGIALHPDFSANNFVYLYYTYEGSGNDTLNRVVKMTYKNKALSEEKVIVDRIPGAANHNGGRIKFGPDKMLYITTGDAGNPSRSQDKSNLAGKILRVTDEGEAAPGNPFNNLVYSYGHRNPQGIDWDEKGNLWETEHGPSGGTLGRGNDELNLILPGKNYGWPAIQGNQENGEMVKPVKHSGTDTTWAPGGAAFYKNGLFFGGLRGEALYQAVIEENKITDFKDHFKNEFGRIREVILGPDQMLYITTSNRDGRGDPKNGDDKILKIDPAKL